MWPDAGVGQEAFRRQRVRVPQPLPYVDEAAPLGARRLRDILQADGGGTYQPQGFPRVRHSPLLRVEMG